MALQMVETLKEAIVVYTGLSPATFFTILALAAAVYYLVSGFFVSNDYSSRSTPEEKIEPLPPPIQLGEITDEELRAYDGSDSKKPLLMSIKGQIYDVSQSRMFYGPGGPYALFAGKDASRALAKMSFQEQDLTGDISGLGPFELEALQDWEYKFMSKYVKVGTVKGSVAGSPEIVAAGEEVKEDGVREKDVSDNSDKSVSVTGKDVIEDSLKPVDHGGDGEGDGNRKVEDDDGGQRVEEDGLKQQVAI